MRSLGHAVAAGVLLFAVLPATEALAAPTVEFLNPSGYSPTIRISDKEDADDTYHLNVWVGEVPTDALVEFELSNAAGTEATVVGTRAGSDAWEGELSLEGVADGQYTLQAILYENFAGVGTGNEVDRSEPMSVLVQAADIPPGSEAETVEITHPENGGQLGFYAAPGKAASAVIEGTTSEGASQVRALYSVSNVGGAPEWLACGSAVPSEGDVSVKCTLQDDGPAARVKAVALVANSTPSPGMPVPPADETGDAHRVVVYGATPTSLRMDPDSEEVDEGTCFAVTATALDQAGNVVSGVNIDIHAQGPDDQLKFANQRGTSDAFQAPDKSHSGTEPTVKCAETDAEGSQGDHNVPGAADQKHIESTTGTGADGSFTFVLRSSVEGGTLITAWSDDNDDDLQGATEASGGAQLGWGTDPPQAPKTLILDPSSTTAATGDCVKMTAVARQGGNALDARDIDVHALGPEGVSFCTPEGGSNAFPPDQGEHAGGYHGDGTGHIEGMTDANGSFVFGVTSARQGTTDLLVWLDNDGDDVFDADDEDEISANGQIGWGGQTKNEPTQVSIRYKRSAFRGAARSAASGCRSERTIDLRKQKRGRDPKVGTAVTNANGNYRIREPRAKGKYYARAAQKTFIDENGDNIVCEAGKSRTKRVR
ncbi:MAG TPA: hypothetical protein VNP73_09935 [Actinomycetota bacterium]|nr:hypothetical protein [Actinomycetota bacterium]